ncbi:MAG TPA: biotin-dependent carboxyltransferase family protein [Vicinamibacterales bacterium]|nr:biotin-dependent carboxyltransferase family protein [Vicinamibacterales bacterium]
MSVDLRVVRPGMLTTVQDLGRWGHQDSGVPVAGPMDPYSHRLANRLVGNAEDAAALEVTLLGPELEASGDLVCAVAGAEFELVAGASVPMHAPFTLASRKRLRFGARHAGARATLAVAGGIAVEPVLGSRATSLISGIGPFGGRALKAGDVLPIGAVEAPPRSGWRAIPLALPAGGARLRVVPGPHDAMFTPGACDTLFSARYVVSVRSNRMGYRLEGPPLAHLGTADILSDATPLGSLQVPASGQPILLMADRQTTGGYPKIATVISADFALAGQLAPGDWVEFAPCTRAAAVDALKEQRRKLAGHAR